MNCLIPDAVQGWCDSFLIGTLSSSFTSQSGLCRTVLPTRRVTPGTSRALYGMEEKSTREGERQENCVKVAISHLTGSEEC